MDSGELSLETTSVTSLTPIKYYLYTYDKDVTAEQPLLLMFSRHKYSKTVQVDVLPCQSEAYMAVHQS